MYPVLLRFGHLTVYSYGVVVALALLTAGYVAFRLLRKHGLRGDLAIELVVAASAGGFAGARLYWLLEHWGEARQDLTSYVFTSAGFTWYGGLIGGFVVVAAWSRARKIPLGLTANIVAPALAAGYALGRVACQLAGDGNYGRPSDLPWAMSYPNGTVPTTVRVQPTPVYETIAMLFAFVVLYRMAKKRQPGWYVFGWFLVLSGIERFLIEFLRRNPVWNLGLTAPQWFALAGVAAGLLLILARRGVPRLSDEASGPRDVGGERTPMTA